MAVTKPDIKTKFSQQEILNQSFDTDYGLLVVEGSGFDGVNSQRINASNLALRIEYDVNSNPVYLGLAAPGTSISTAKWQIRKLTFDVSGNITAIEYAGGTPNFNVKWDDRAAGGTIYS